MSFDSSRFTFNPWNNFSGVVMEQGRVQLDSDWNEWMAQLARRLRAGTVDVLGRAVVPATTPKGFEIRLHTDSSGLTTFEIGPGRIYVDGLLAENHGSPAPDAQLWTPASGAPPPPLKLPEWDSVLDELSGKHFVSYAGQPSLPGCAVSAPFSQAQGPCLVYVDVWQREVTFLEDPDLVEKAVGVDTTGRLQTVWQVKWLDVSSVPGVSCSTPDDKIPGWSKLLRPSGARLTTGVVPNVSAGPCCLSPTTGYTGLENQLYRVEVHQPGAAGKATFKWSRDNGSVATGVTAIAATINAATNQPASVLTVQSTGRDSVLSFLPGNWIEILDDTLELNGLPGQLLQIAPGGVNAGARTITLTTAVSATDFPLSGGQTDPSRHTRIRRWDQSGQIYTTDSSGTESDYFDLDTAAQGDIPIPAAANVALVLENGVTVVFALEPNGADFKTGDFWNFAARASDGTVEFLDRSPPRGIFHHYARLAVVGFASNLLPGPSALQDLDAPPVEFLGISDTAPSGWPKNFGVSVRQPTDGKVGHFDLGVFYDPPSGGVGVTLPVQVELFENLTFDATDARYAPAVINGGSNLIAVPVSYNPPATIPTLALSAAFPAAPGTMLAGTGTMTVAVGSVNLTVQATPSANWPGFFGIAARAATQPSATFDLEVFYLPQDSGPVQVEFFPNLSLSALGPVGSSQFAVVSLPTPPPPPELILPATFQAGQVSDCRELWPANGDCYCTACVTADSQKNGILTIQMAVDQVIAAGGGTVCLGAGAFFLDATVAIAVSSATVSLCILGEGAATQVTLDLGLASAFEITAGSQNVCLENFALSLSPGGASAGTTGVLVDANGQSILLRQLELSGFGSAASFVSGSNFVVDAVTVTNNSGQALVFGSSGNACQNLLLRGLTVSSAGGAVALADSTDATLEDLNVSTVGTAVELASSSNIRVQGLSMLNDSGASAAVTIGSSSGITIEDLVLSGSRSGAAVTVTSGASQSTEVLLRGLSVTSAGPAVSIASATNVTVRDLWASINGNSTAVSVTAESSGVLLSNLSIAGGGVAVDVESSSGVTVRDLTMLNSNSTFGAVIINASNTVTVDNFNLTGGRTGIAIAVAAGGAQTQGVVLRGISVASAGQALVIAGAENLTVQGLFIASSSTSAAVAVEQSTNITIRDVTVPSASAGTVTIDSSTFITIDNLSVSGTTNAAAIAITSSAMSGSSPVVSEYVLLRGLSVAAAGPVVTADTCFGLTVQSVTAILTGKSFSAFSATDCLLVSLQDVAVDATQLTGATVPLLLLATCMAVKCDRLTLAASHAGAATDSPMIGLCGLLYQLSICDCTIGGTVGIGSFYPTGGPHYLYSTELTISDSVLNCSQLGIVFADQVILAGQNRVAGCEVTNCAVGAITLTAMTLASGSVVEIASNAIAASVKGITASAVSLRIHDNVVGAGKAGAVGIAVVPGPVVGVDFCQIEGNQLADLPGPAILIETPVGDISISGNVIAATEQGILFAGLGSADSVAIFDNQLSGLDSLGSYTVAIGVVQAVNAKITNNHIDGVVGMRTLHVAGIQVVACGDVLIAENRVAGIGVPTGFTGTGAGIEVYGPIVRATIQGNQVRRDETASTVNDGAMWTALAIGLPPVLAAPPAGAAILNDALAVLQSASQPGVYVITSATIWKDLATMGPVSVTGNRFEGRGDGQTVSIDIPPNDCGFTSNQCSQVGSPAMIANNKLTQGSVIVIDAGTVIFGSNRVTGTASNHFVELIVPAGTVIPVSVVGNLTTGDISVNANPLAAPWSPLNVII